MGQCCCGLASQSRDIFQYREHCSASSSSPRDQSLCLHSELPALWGRVPLTTLPLGVASLTDSLWMASRSCCQLSWKMARLPWPELACCLRAESLRAPRVDPSLRLFLASMLRTRVAAADSGWEGRGSLCPSGGEVGLIEEAQIWAARSGPRSCSRSRQEANSDVHTRRRMPGARASVEGLLMDTHSPTTASTAPSCAVPSAGGGRGGAAPASMASCCCAVSQAARGGIKALCSEAPRLRAACSGP